MWCHQCNQNSIKIVMEDGVHIQCDICGLDIEGGDKNPLLCDLFIYNENLEEAEKLGIEAFSDGKSLDDNPYSLNSSQIILNKRWEDGYDREKESYEYSALSLSAEKIQKQQNKEISELTKKLKDLQFKISIFMPENHKKVNGYLDNLLSHKVLGLLLKKEILSYKKDYMDFDITYWDYRYT